MNFNIFSSSVQYKFKELKIYESPEYLADNMKNYRTVFDKSELSYVYAELSFYNKWLDKKNWTANVLFKVYQVEIEKKILIAEITSEEDILKEEAICYVRDGWGKDEIGTFWEKGRYFWEVYLNGEWLGETDFFIEDVGIVSANQNPYFDLLSTKLYELGDTFEQDIHTYQTEFENSKTRYIWLELSIKNLQTEAWNGEFFFYVYNKNSKLVYYHNLFRTINVVDTETKLNCGWGALDVESWDNGDYKLIVLFMEQIIDTIHFKVF